MPMMPDTEPKANVPRSTSLIERAVLASIADGVIVNAVSGEVILLNQSASDLLRVDPAAVMGTPVRALFESFSTRGRLTMVDAMDRLYSDPYSYAPGEGITETILDLGRQVIQAHLSPVLTEVGEFIGIVTVLRDITREIEAERAKSEFVSNVSHELRTPLTSIVGYTSLLANHVVGPINDQQANFLKVVQTNADRLVTLINDLLDISRIESGRLELNIQPIALETVIRDVAEMLKPQCDQKSLTLKVVIEPGLVFVLGDKNRLVQIIANLASNACRYTLAGGSITLALSQSGDTARVDVADTGIGIGPEDQAKIFQRFYRVNNAAIFETNGTGLGLPITKMLVEMHGGRMWVKSEVNHGSTFTFVLPIQAEAPAIEDGQLVGVPVPGRTVLVVEDEPEIAHLIDLHLRHEGLHVLTTAWGEEALTLARTRAIDLITLDMSLPDITGMEVLRRLKADPATREIPVVIVSVIREDHGGHRGAADQASKPFAVEKLLDSVRHALETKRLGLAA